MIVSKPKVDPGGLYSLSQAARALEMNRHTVAHYRDEGMIRFRIRRYNKKPVVTGADIIKFWRSTII